MIEALAYIVGFSVLVTLLSPDNAAEMTNLDKLAFSIEHRQILELWNMFIYVVFGIVLVVLVSALHERLKVYASSILSIATVFGFIWSGLVIASGMVANVGMDKVAQLYLTNSEHALVLWQTIGVMQDALGGGVEIVGGMWVLLISWVALKNNELPKLLNYLGLLVGVTGVITVLPALGYLGAIFGLGQIAWFIWLGIFMLRNHQLTKRAGKDALTRAA